MQYKTIVLAWIEQQPILHARLRESRTLLATMERSAHALKARHETWMEALRQRNPGGATEQIASEALELALEELRGMLPAESPPDAAAGPPPLPAAMDYLRRYTPPA